MTARIPPMQWRRVEVTAAPESAPPFAPDAVVAEEDTFLVLSADPEIREPRFSRLRAVHEAFTVEPAEPGTVVVRGARPLKLMAVVHDLSQVPTWREEWVATALEGVLREAEVGKVHALAMPLLGRVHGALPLDAFVALLRAALDGFASRHLERVWLITPEDALDEVRAALASGLFR